MVVSGHIITYHEAEDSTLQLDGQTVEQFAKPGSYKISSCPIDTENKCRLPVPIHHFKSSHVPLHPGSQPLAGISQRITESLNRAHFDNFLAVANQSLI